MNLIKKYYKEFSDELKDYKKVPEKQLKEFTEEQIEDELNEIKKALQFSAPNLCYIQQGVMFASFVEATLHKKGFFFIRIEV